jgi:hypothetical protein
LLTKASMRIRSIGVVLAASLFLLFSGHAQAGPTLFQRARTAQSGGDSRGLTVARSGEKTAIKVGGLRRATLFQFDGEAHTGLLTRTRKGDVVRERSYAPVGHFAAGALHGEALVSRQAGKAIVRLQFEPGANPALDGNEVTIVVGPRDGWTQGQKMIERRSLNVRGDVAQAVFTERELERTFGTAQVAAYARIRDKATGEVSYINLDGQPGKNFELPQK